MPNASVECGQEFATCGAEQPPCCWPMLCYRQSAFYSQCGRACPLSASWDCAAEPRIALFVARWGEWPPWMPAFTKTLASNPTVRFILLGDEVPTHELPANAIAVPCTLDELAERARRRVGAELSLSARGVAARLPNLASASKTNDLAGDGTTTATILAQSIVKEGLKNGEVFQTLY